MLRMRSQIFISLAVLAVTLAACGQDRVGNAPTAPLTLRAETGFGPDEVSPYVRRGRPAVGRHGFAWTCSSRPASPLDIEAQIVDRVASGSLDIGFVGTRTWAGQDVHAFDALQAPFLIDSYELQQAVLEGGIFDETDDSLESLGLVSLGILPGPLRVPAGREGPYVGAADYTGSKIGMSDAAITEATLGALGASAIAIPFEAEGRFEGVDGMEGHVGAVPFDGPGAMRFVTGNVVLWPRPISVVINAERFAGLTAGPAGMAARGGGRQHGRDDRPCPDPRSREPWATPAGTERSSSTRAHRTWPGSAPPSSRCTAACARTRRPAAQSTRSRRSATRMASSLACPATAEASGTQASPTTWPGHDPR